MLTFAAWHGLAIASAVFSGLFSFALKVGAERTHSSAVLNAIGAFVSLALSTLVAFFLQEHITTVVVFWAILNGITFIVGSVSRSDALAYIDATLFFPLYKVVGPTLVLIAGVVLFGERLTVLQAIGFFFAIAVPLLLLDRSEHHRQKDVRRGVWLMFVTALTITLGTITSKFALNAGAEVFIFSAVAYGVTFAGITVPYITKGGELPHQSTRFSEIVFIGSLIGLLQFLGFVTLILAYKYGPISTTYAINSTYILIPIVLSIWYYGEHWNARKVIAIGLSVVAVVLLR